MVRAREGCREARGSSGELAFVVCDIAYEEVLVNFVEGDLARPEIRVHSTATWCYMCCEARSALYPGSGVRRVHDVPLSIAVSCCCVIC